MNSYFSILYTRTFELSKNEEGLTFGEPFYYKKATS